MRVYLNICFLLLNCHLLQEGTVQPDIFTIRLQKELDSQRQPGLAAFLKVFA